MDRVWGSGWGSRFGVWIWGFRVVQGFGIRIQGFRAQVQGSGIGIAQTPKSAQTRHLEAHLQWHESQPPCRTPSPALWLCCC
jgi:hypothetical protein